MVLEHQTAGSTGRASLTVAGNLNVPNVQPKRLSGTISTTGTVSMRYDGSWALGGFTAANGAFVLSSSSGLNGSGNFNITAAGAAFNTSVFFSGSIPATGLFDLAGTAALSFGAYKTDLFNMKLSKDSLFLGAGGSPNLYFGALKVPFHILLVVRSDTRSRFLSRQSKRRSQRRHRLGRPLFRQPEQRQPKRL